MGSGVGDKENWSRVLGRAPTTKRNSDWNQLRLDSVEGKSEPKLWQKDWISCVCLGGWMGAGKLYAVGAVAEDLLEI